MAKTAPIAELLTGRVVHTRLRPKRNGFSYRVYQLRLPLRALERAGWPGTPLLRRNGFGLLSFHDADHGDGKTPLLEWIKGVLAQNGIDDADGEIWLHCFPRVFGYVFNPVSFWFCERADGGLRAVVCEVNNTFGERHCYLLANDDGAPISSGQKLTTQKLFHVSPFCRVEGAYDFHFRRRAANRHDARIDYRDADGPLLLTGISGIARPLTTGALLWAFCRMPMMTFGVVARIHWQALRLWLRGVPFFSKPESPATEVSR